jgi:hypothetical protein
MKQAVRAWKTPVPYFLFSSSPQPPFFSTHSCTSDIKSVKIAQVPQLSWCLHHCCRNEQSIFSSPHPGDSTSSEGIVLCFLAANYIFHQSSTEENEENHHLPNAFCFDAIHNVLTRQYDLQIQDRSSTICKQWNQPLWTSSRCSLKKNSISLCNLTKPTGLERSSTGFNDYFRPVSKVAKVYWKHYLLRCIYCVYSSPT